MKIKLLVGNRPQFIKAAAIFRACSSEESSFHHTFIQLIHSGQHYDSNMSEIFFDEMDLPKPDWYLGIKESTHGKMTGKMISAIEDLLIQGQTDCLLVLGDTNTTLAGAIAATKLHIPIAHVEAGLRSFNRKMPEEINRVLTDHASDLLFTPTKAATKQLQKEGIDSSKIHQVGDVMLDVFLYYRHKAENQSGILKKLGLNSKEYVLATIHREENTGNIERLREIINGLKLISELNPVVLPLHPRTKKVIEEHHITTENIIVMEPVGYFDMISLENNATAIVTDSGGVQKEAYFCNVPCITVRDETEWIELVEHGFNHLVSPDKDNILKMYQNLKNLSLDWDKKLYGNGNASKTILEKICDLKN